MKTWTRLVGIKSCQTKAWMTSSEEREALMFVLKLRREQRESRPVKLRGSQWYLSYPSLLLQPVACARLVFILVASDQQLHRMVTRQDEV